MLCVDTHKIQRNAALALSLVVALSIALSVALLLTVNVVSSLILVLINCSINRQSNLTEATQEAITMKNPLSALLLALLLTITFTPVQAQIFPPIPVFDGATGVMKVPTLLFEGKPYYLEFSVADVAALTFKIEEDSLVDLTPDGSTTGKTTQDIVGTWEVDGEATEVTFNADGSWKLSQEAGDDLEACPDGGDEIGTFRYTPVTGVFMPIFQSDGNGQCGLSNVEGLIRIFTDGNVMTIQFTSEDTATLNLIE